MKPLPAFVGFAACLVVATAATRAESHEPPGPASPGLLARLSAGAAAGERLLSLKELRLFYGERAQRPAWSDGGKLSPQLKVLLTALRTADREGLRPEDYHLAAIDALLARLRPANHKAAAAAGRTSGGDAVDLDLLLSDAFFLYASHLTAGRVSPESVEPEWNIAGRECCGIPDAVGPSSIVDLKVTRDGSPGKFPWHARRMGWLGQLAWYDYGLFEGKAINLSIVSVEDLAPHLVTVYRLTPDAAEMGHRIWRSHFERLRVCEDSDVWPGYSDCVVPLEVDQEFSLHLGTEEVTVE